MNTSKVSDRFTKQLNALMDEKGISQANLVRLCKPYSDLYGVTIHKSNICQYVNGTNEPSYGKIPVLSKALGVPVDYFYKENVVKEPTKTCVRVDCEKCVNSEFYDGDKVRCNVQSCTPDYEDMKECRKSLLECFPGSFVNEQDEFIAHLYSNTYFILKGCEYPEDIDCKVLEWLSRPAIKGIPYNQEWRNVKFRKQMKENINSYLGTSFSNDDFIWIYEELGNAVNHSLTKAFVNANFDMNLLKN